MRSQTWIWGGVGIVSALAALLFVGGLLWSVLLVVGSQQNAAFSVDTSTNSVIGELERDGMQIVALGDSLTKGTGDGEGLGYVQRLRQMLNGEVYVLSFAVNGYDSDQLLQALQEETIQAAVREADLIVMTIGANDLFRAGSEIDVDAAYESMPSTLERLSQIWDKLVLLNQDAEIMYLGLYNPFGDWDSERSASRFVLDWNAQANALALSYDHIRVVPTFDLFGDEPRGWLASDAYHPNAQGYQRMAERVAQTLATHHARID